MPAPTRNASPSLAPAYTLYRQEVVAVDVVADATRQMGMNMEGYEYAHIQVIPTGVDATVQVYAWSDAVGEFIEVDEFTAVAGVGSGVPHEFTIACRSRVIFVAVTVLAAGSCDIAVAGSRYIVQPVA